MSTTTPLQDERFLLLERIGRGASADVLGAFDRCEGRAVALKVPLGRPTPAGPGHPLVAEFEAASRLDHPNVVRSIDLAVAERGPLPDGTPYLVLERAGRPLDRALPPGGASCDVLEAVAVQALAALAHVHEAGLVHRDVKPANLLVEPGLDGAPRVRLVDFGLAVAAGERRPPGTFSGSLAWIAPECLLGAPLDARVDLYALGLVLRRLAGLGGPPSVADPAAVMTWHLAGPELDPSAVPPGLRSALGELLCRLTRRRPAARPRDARDALAVLGASVPPPPVARPARAERATLRLAFDAARLGARRSIAVPGAADAADAARREARILARTRGVLHDRLPAAPPDIARMVLRVLCAAGDAAALTRRHALDRVLPLRIVGGEPMFDDRAGGAVPRGLVSCVGRVLVEVAARRTIVLDASTCPAGSAGAAVGAWLARRIDDRGPAAGTGGLLLLSPRRPPATGAGNSGPG